MISRIGSKFLRLYGSIVYFILWITSYFFFYILCNVEIEGRENIPKRGRFIIASNHQNFFDGSIIANLFSPFKKLNFLISKRPLKSKIYQYFAKVIGFVVIGSGVDEYTRALKRLNNYLTHGGVVGIFPEGVVTGFNTPTRFKGGVAKLSLDSRTNVVPVYLNGTYRLRESKYLFSRPTITIKIGKPLDLYNYAEICGNNLDKMAAVLRERVVDLYEPRQISILEEPNKIEQVLAIDLKEPSIAGS